MSDHTRILKSDEPDDVGKIARAIAKAFFGNEELCWADLTEERRKRCVKVAKEVLHTRTELREEILSRFDAVFFRFHEDLLQAILKLKSIEPFEGPAQAFDAMVASIGDERSEFCVWLGKVMR